MKTTFKYLICFVTAIAIMALTSCTKEIDTIIAEESENLSAITLVTLSAVDTFSGPCSKIFDFEAEIKADGPMTVTYTWLRSDGVTAPEVTLVFEEAGVKTVSTSWTLGESGNSYEGFWQQLKVISPEVMLSNKSEFDLHCDADTIAISAVATVVGADEITTECPEKIDFEADITVDGPVTITYAWLRSVGGPATENTLEFEEAGTKTITTSWTLGASGNNYEGYWQQLKVIAPQEVLSNKATFDLFCDDEVVGITATATVVGEDDFSGECPKRFDFEGVITADGPATITYTWLRSDGATGPENTLEFTEAGSQTVNISWTLGGSGNQYEGYWRQLKVITPQEVLSERAEFDLDCDGVTRIDFSTFGGETRILSESALTADGIERIRTVISSSYCDDAEPALREAGDSGSPFSLLGTGNPGTLGSCQGMPLEFTFTEPVKRVIIEFYGAAVDYSLTSYNEVGAELNSATETAIPYDYSTPSTVAVEEGSATISRVVFGYTAAATRIRSITFVQ
ncbi:hypothetical protein N9954_06615 [Maribacter sp.]|nr:hypothetical protein [Maribacter sp.]